MSQFNIKGHLDDLKDAVVWNIIYTEEYKSLSKKKRPAKAEKDRMEWLHFQIKSCQDRERRTTEALLQEFFRLKNIADSPDKKGYEILETLKEFIQENEGSQPL